MTPESGIYTAFIAGFIVHGIVVQYGVANLLICTLTAGFMLLAMGLLRMGTWIRFIPVSVIRGFTKGIAVLILLSQVRNFLGLSTGQLPADFFAQIAVLWQALHTSNGSAVALALACLALIVFWPQACRVVPAPIVALVAGTTTVALFNLPVETIGSRFGGIPQTLSAFAFPELSVATMRHRVAPAIAIALLGAIESLLSATVADNMIDDRRKPNQELMVQGIANIVAPLFGSFCAAGALARTTGQTRAAGRAVGDPRCRCLEHGRMGPLPRNAPLHHELPRHSARDFCADGSVRSDRCSRSRADDGGDFFHHRRRSAATVVVPALGIRANAR